jgi:hypothetical protein
MLLEDASEVEQVDTAVSDVHGVPRGTIPGGVMPRVVAVVIADAVIVVGVSESDTATSERQSGSDDQDSE